MYIFWFSSTRTRIVSHEAYLLFLCLPPPPSPCFLRACRPRSLAPVWHPGCQCIVHRLCYKCVVISCIGAGRSRVYRYDNAKSRDAASAVQQTKWMQYNELLFKAVL